MFSGYKKQPYKKSVFICVHPWLKNRLWTAGHPKGAVTIVH